LRAYKIQSDFSMARGVARLEDFYANLPGDAHFSADGACTLKTRGVSGATIGVRGLGVAALNPLRAEGWSITGQVDTVVKLAFTPKTLSITSATVQLSPVAAMRMPEGSVAVSGSPGVSLAVRGTMDLEKWTVNLDSAALHGVGQVNM